MKTMCLAAAAILTFSTGAFAEDLKPATKPIPATYDWSACKAEIEKVCKGVEGNEAIYACLLKHDEDNSKACDAVHTKYEIATGRK